MNTFQRLVPHLAGLAVAAGTAAQNQQASIGDSRIELAIEGELIAAKRIAASNLNVEVRDGVVTLSGRASSILEKDRSVRIAQMVKGVRSVIDQIDVKQTDRPAQDIRADVLAALAADPATESWDTGVQVADGVVTLTGSVESYAEREIATKVAKGVRGVREVRSEISITPPAARADSEIAEEIRQRMAWDALLRDGLIDVTVSDGAVTLSGAVGSAYERTRAIADAWSTGVTEVDAEELEVRWWANDDMERPPEMATPSDGEIRRAVEDAFLFDPRVYSFQPEVSVDNGVVTLTGEVGNLKARRAAAQDAANTIGVRQVRNYLKVRPATRRTDAEIARDIRDAIERDPVVERFDLSVNVLDGVAYLYGEADSYYERSQAEDVAARISGVIDVENHVDVDYDAWSYSSYYDWDPTLYDYDFDYSTTSIKPDEEIAEAIESQLFWSPFVDENEVVVAVDAGVATLTGTVDSWSERTAATENAIEGGAVRVNNLLDIER